MHRFSAKVIEQLSFYVYLYIDPRTNEPFYIGKGKGNRVFSHLNDQQDSEKVRKIQELRDLKLEPKIELLKYGLTEPEALLVEATAIDLLDVENLTNSTRGHGSRYGARASVDEVVATLDAKEVTITEPALLITINQAFRYGMSTMELYDATRSAWKLGIKRHEAKFALSVYRGIVREVFEISGWIPGGMSIRSDDEMGRRDKPKGRWEFVGVVAEDRLREKYIGKSVRHYLGERPQNPIKYVNCD